MMDQQRFEKLLEAYLDGRLDDTERRDFFDAVGQNDAWAEQLRREESLQKMLRERSKPSLTEGFSTKVMDAIRTETRVEKKRSAIIQVMHSRPAHLAAAAMLMAVVGLGVLSRIDLNGDYLTMTDAPVASRPLMEEHKDQKAGRGFKDDIQKGSLNIADDDLDITDTADDERPEPLLNLEMTDKGSADGVDDERSAISNMVAGIKDEEEKEIGIIAMRREQENETQEDVGAASSSSGVEQKRQLNKELSPEEMVMRTEALLGNISGRENGLGERLPTPTPRPEKNTPEALPEKAPAPVSIASIPGPENDNKNQGNTPNSVRPGLAPEAAQDMTPEPMAESKTPDTESKKDKLKALRFYDLYALEQDPSSGRNRTGGGAGAQANATLSPDKAETGNYDDATNLQNRIGQDDSGSLRKPRETAKPVAEESPTVVDIIIQSMQAEPRSKAAPSEARADGTSRMARQSYFAADSDNGTQTATSALDKNASRQMIVNFLEKMDKSGLEIESISTNRSGTTVVRCKVYGKDLKRVEKTLQSFTQPQADDQDSTQSSKQSSLALINQSNVADDEILHFELRIVVN